MYSTSPLVSIIIPIYKSEPYLPRLIASLNEQSYSNLEFIFVNDGSPDASEEICLQFKNNDKRVKYFYQENEGAASALNRGINIATGDFLMFIDADDWIHSSTCELAITNALKYSVDMVFWSFIKEYGTKSVPGPLIFSSEKLFKNEDLVFLRRRMIGLKDKELSSPTTTDLINTGWGKLIKTSVIKDNNILWTDTNVVGSSDVLFNASFMPFIQSAFFLPKHLYHYTKNNANSLTKTYATTLFHKLKRLYSKLEREIILIYYPENDKFYEALNNRIALSIVNISLSLSTIKDRRLAHEKLKEVLLDPKYKRALQKLKLKEMPLSYQLFFLLCRYSQAWLILLIAKLVRKVR